LAGRGGHFAITFSNGGALRFNGAIYGRRAQLVITGNAQDFRTRPTSW